MTSVAILGAGSSGLAAAHVLQDAGYRVTLFEKSRGVGGRAATRRRDGFIYDHGAQYIKGNNPLVTQRFRTPDLIDIDKPVWIFDVQGHIAEGDPQQNTEPKWGYRSGLTALAKQMVQGLDIRLETYIGRIEQLAAGWRLFDVSGQVQGKFEQLLITIPASQAVELIEASRLNAHLSEEIRTYLHAARYNPLLSVMLGYRPRPESRPYYALVNTDKAHAISWLAWEHEKSLERVPEGAGLLIAQMAPHYSRDSQQTAQEEIVRDVAQRVADLIDEPLPEPLFTDIQYWHYALPAEKADADHLNALTLPIGLAFCGDGFVGGRVHLALEHGTKVAQQLIKGEM